MHSKLRVGLTAEEVAGLLGEPNNGRIQPCVDCSFTYLPPLGSLTANKNGYTGLRIWFTGGKVSAWHIYTGNPSYAEPTMPLGLRRFAWFFGIMFAFGIISKLLIRLTPVATVVAAEVAQAFERRDIRTEKLPGEFRFITRETTLQEVFDKPTDERGGESERERPCGQRPEAGQPPRQAAPRARQPPSQAAPRGR